MEKQELINLVDSTLARITEIDKERISLVEYIKSIIPIKEGDKVQVFEATCESEDDKPVRLAYVAKININPRGVDRKARIEFDLLKCKKDGVQSAQTDRLKVNEYIKKLSNYDIIPDIVELVDDLKKIK